MSRLMTITRQSATARHGALSRVVSHAIAVAAAFVAATAAAIALLAAATTAHAIEIQVVKGPRSGVTAWLVEDHTVPLVAMDFSFTGGAVNDPRGKEGLATFLSAMLDEGAGDMKSAAFQARMEELAMRMSFNAGREYFSGSLRALTRNRDESFRLLKMALASPRFDSRPLERIRRQLIVSIRRKGSDPEHTAFIEFKKLLLGDDSPYARDTDGSEKGVMAVTAADLHDLRKRLFARSGLIVAVAGDIDAATLSRLLDETFGSLPEKSAMAEAPPPRIPANGALQVVSRPIPQTIIIMGHEGMVRSHPDFIPAYVANFILGGGGFGSRLTEEVREKRGLTYSVYSAMFAWRKRGVFFAQASTRNDKAGEALDIMKREIARMAEQGPTEKELEEAKTYLIGSYPLRFDSTTKIASGLLAIRRDNLGVDYIKKRNGLIGALTREQVARAARELLKPKALRILLLGRPKGVHHQ